jgi:hypothetical protein
VRNSKRLIIKAHVFLIIFGCCVALITCELGVRAWRGRLLDFSQQNLAFYPHPTQQAPRAQYDETLGWIPNTGRRMIAGVEYNVREDNLRSNGPQSISKAFEKVDILTLGDSYTFGDEVGDDATVPSILEQLTRQPIANGGVFGYGIDQMVLRAERLSPTYQPKTIILSFIADDVARVGSSFREHPKPFFILENGELVLKNVPVPKLNVMPVSRFDVIRRLLGYSHLIDSLMRRLDPELWLSRPLPLENQNQNVPRLNANTLDVSCRLMERLRRSIGKEARIIVIGLHYFPLSQLDAETTQKFLTCATTQGFETYDFYQQFVQLRDSDPATFAANYYVRHHPNRRLNQIIAETIFNRFFNTPNTARAP